MSQIKIRDYLVIIKVKNAKIALIPHQKPLFTAELVFNEFLLSMDIQGQ